MEGNGKKLIENTKDIEYLKKDVGTIKKHLWVIQGGLWGLILVLLATDVIQLEDITKFVAFVF